MHLGFCRDEASLARWARASNVEVVRKKKTGTIVQINVAAVLEEPEVDSKGKPVHGIGPNSVRPVYDDVLPTGPLVTMKRLNEDGHFERWPHDEGFNPRRFNPDLLRRSQVGAFA